MKSPRQSPFGTDDLKKEQFDFVIQTVGIKSDDDENIAETSLTVDVTLKNFLDQNGAVVRRRFRLLKYKNNSSCLELPPADKTTTETQPISALRFRMSSWRKRPNSKDHGLEL